MRCFKILCVVLLASLLIACHEISSGTVVDKYIDEPHTTFIPVVTGKSSVLGQPEPKEDIFWSFLDMLENDEGERE